jgi:phage/conjugal plasmid C-4 type zinc finger TraR family protein
MTDIFDRATEREEEFRADSIEAWARRRNAGLGEKSATHCRICEEPIPLARRRVVPGVQTCVHCQQELEYSIVSGGD